MVRVKSTLLIVARVEYDPKRMATYLLSKCASIQSFSSAQVLAKTRAVMTASYENARKFFEHSPGRMR